MYLGHILFLAGLTLTLHSWLGALVTAATTVWFQSRVRRDERRLEERFGQPYREYSARVRRWIGYSGLTSQRTTLKCAAASCRGSSRCP